MQDILCNNLGGRGGGRESKATITCDFQLHTVTN